MNPGTASTPKTLPEQPIKFYRAAIYGPAHRVELFLSLLGLPFGSNPHRAGRMSRRAVPKATTKLRRRLTTARSACDAVANTAALGAEVAQ